MTYTTDDLAPVWRDVFTSITGNQPHTYATFTADRRADGVQDVHVEHLDTRRGRFAVCVPAVDVDPNGGRVGAASLMPYSRPGTYGPRTADGRHRVGAHRPRHVPAGAPVVDVVDVAAVLAHVATYGRGADVRVTAADAVAVVAFGEGRVGRFADALPGVGESVLTCRATDAASWAAAARLFRAAEGPGVVCRFADVGLPGLLAFRLRVDAPSGAWAVLDLSEDADPAGTVTVAAAVDDVLPRVAAVVGFNAPPARLVVGDRLVLDVHGGNALVRPLSGLVQARGLPASFVDGRASTCVDPFLLRAAFARLDGGPCRLLVSERPTDPLLVTSADGRRITAVLPCVTSALYPLDTRAVQAARTAA